MCWRGPLLSAFIFLQQILTHALFIHLCDIYLIHLLLLTIPERFAEIFVLLRQLLITLYLLFLEHFFVNVHSLRVKLSLVEYILGAFHKVFLLLVVTVVYRAVYLSNYFLVP